MMVVVEKEVWGHGYLGGGNIGRVMVVVPMVVWKRNSGGIQGSGGVGEWWWY